MAIYGDIWQYMAIYGNISLNSSQNENCFQTKFVEKIETHILCSWTCFRKSFHLWDYVEQAISVGIT
jgi:hypothetical protein